MRQTCTGLEPNTVNPNPHEPRLIVSCIQQPTSHCKLAPRELQVTYSKTCTNTSRIICFRTQIHNNSYDKYCVVNCSNTYSVLNWFKSYLSSRLIRVKCDKCLSSSYSCLCSIPQGSVLGSWSLTFHHVYLSSQYPFLFSIIKPPSLCWWYTNFLSFYGPDFLSNISYLFNA